MQPADVSTRVRRRHFRRKACAIHAIECVEGLVLVLCQRNVSIVLVSGCGQGSVQTNVQLVTHSPLRHEPARAQPQLPTSTTPACVSRVMPNALMDALDQVLVIASEAHNNVWVGYVTATTNASSRALQTKSSMVLAIALVRARQRS